MKLFLVFFAIYLLMFLVDKFADFKSEKSLNITYFLYNIIIFGSLQFLYVRLYFSGFMEKSSFIYIRIFYSLFINVGLLVMLVKEVLKTRRFKDLLLSVKFLVVSIITVVLFPLTIGVAVAKELMDLLYSNIKVNYLMLNRRYSDQGYETLIRPEIFDEKFYKGIYFQDIFLNKIFRYYSASYEYQAINKIIVYPTRELNDNKNIEKIRSTYLKTKEDTYSGLSNIKFSLMNRYRDNIIFELENLIELENLNRFMSLLVPELTEADKVDFNYKIYILDLVEVNKPIMFKEFTVNRPVAHEYDMVRSMEISPNLDEIDEESLQQYLYSLVKKELIYTHILEYFDVEEEGKFYEINVTDYFQLNYNRQDEVFYITSNGMELGKLEDQALLDASRLNLPLNEDIFLDLNKELTSEDQKVYNIYDRDNPQYEAYLMYFSIFIELDFSNIKRDRRPSLSLEVDLSYNLNIIE